jgi:hypothetical protein
MFAGKARGLP